MNRNTETGIRFGVISCQSLHPELVDELMYGPGAVDLNYEAAYKEAKFDAHHRFSRVEEEASIAVAERGGFTDDEAEAFINARLEDALGTNDREEFVSLELERFSDMYQCDSTSIEGEHEGIKYGISSLGGANLLWVYEGPIGYANCLCSPCIPGAADLDSGFSNEKTFGHECYVVPEPWMAKVEA